MEERSRWRIRHAGSSVIGDWFAPVLDEDRLSVGRRSRGFLKYGAALKARLISP